MTAYYNEFDPKTAAWLRELITRGLIADGVVDDRSILDVSADDLGGFTQCHFFAGIGGWSYALRLAGWSDDHPVWTGSPPCQPFSTAGKLKGKKDECHLAPHFVDLVRTARPGMLFGEQVASAEVFGKVAKRAGNPAENEPAWAWIDDLSDRLEAARYTVGASDIPVAGVGGPHIRQRTLFGAVGLDHTEGDGRDKWWPEPVRGSTSGRRGGHRVGHRVGLVDSDDTINGGEQRLHQKDGSGLRSGYKRSRTDSIMLGDTDHTGSQGHRRPRDVCFREQDGSNQGRQHVDTGIPCRLADTDERQRGRVANGEGCECHGSQAGREQGDSEPQSSFTTSNPWRDVDWIPCRDGKVRPVRSGTFPLANGVSARVGRLRGYGNAINPQAAAEFIRAFDAATRDCGY